MGSETPAPEGVHLSRAALARLGWPDSTPMWRFYHRPGDFDLWFDVGAPGVRQEATMAAMRGLFGIRRLRPATRHRIASRIGDGRWVRTSHVSGLWTDSRSSVSDSGVLIEDFGRRQLRFAPGWGVDWVSLSARGRVRDLDRWTGSLPLPLHYAVHFELHATPTGFAGRIEARVGVGPAGVSTLRWTIGAVQRAPGALSAPLRTPPGPR